MATMIKPMLKESHFSPTIVVGYCVCDSAVFRESVRNLRNLSEDTFVCTKRLLVFDGNIWGTPSAISAGLAIATGNLEVVKFSAC